MKRFLIGLPRTYKRILQIALDVGVVWLALWLAFAARLGFDMGTQYAAAHGWMFWALPLISAPVFALMGMYRAVVRYLGVEALITMVKGVTVSTLLFALVIYLEQTGSASTLVLPRSLVFIYWMLALFLLGGMRLAMRYYLSDTLLVNGFGALPFLKEKPRLPRVIIYGAGASGNQLLHALRMSNDMEPIAFVDDDENLHNRYIGGVRVYPPNKIQRIINRKGAKEILLAIPSATRARRQEILSVLKDYSLHVRSIPGYMDLASGRVQVQDLQDVDVADLLGRDAVAPMPELFEPCIKNKVVMVTGAGGSIGSELCRQIFTNGATTLILFEHDEYSLYRIYQELITWANKKGYAVQLVPILGSIRNFHRLLEVMQAWKVDTVYHAAAYKHVPIVEHNITEGVLNNVKGTLYAAEAAIAAGVASFVLVSTDKAVRPTNIMGSTKRLAELILMALSKEKEHTLFSNNSNITCVNNTRFTMVRFGNVLGSSGSVVPLFREQIRKGGPVTVTHPEITRFFMTIAEASQLVIQAGSMGEGGDVFVLDMGEPVKIANLAEKMIQLTGHSVRNSENPNGDIAIEYTGLRPGEKLYEELLIGDNDQPTAHPKIMRANERMLPWSELKQVLMALREYVATENYEALRQLLRDVVEGYEPQGAIVDWVYQQNQEAAKPKLKKASL